MIKGISECKNENEKGISECRRRAQMTA